MLPAAKGPITLLLGGVRAGKSARAVALAAENRGAGRVLFVATAPAFDDEMRRRIDRHRLERPLDWETLESPMDLVRDIESRCAATPAGFAAVIVDCLTLWVSNIQMTLAESDDVERIVAGRVNDLLALCRRLSSKSDGAGHQPVGHWIFVSNEVGLGIVPATPMGRRYRDALGRANQLVAAAASDVTLMVAGVELPLKPR